MRSVIVLLVAVVGLFGCPAEKPVVVASAADVRDAGTDLDASVVIIDAGPPAPTVLEPTVIAAFGDGGTIALTSQATIEPASSLTITLPVKLKDFRLRLLDWRDQVVASDDEVLADGRTYLVALPEPLKSGRSYTLVLDAELGPVVTSEAGATFNDWELAFRIAGEVQPDAPARSKSAPKKKPGNRK